MTSRSVVRVVVGVLCAFMLFWGWSLHEMALAKGQTWLLFDTALMAATAAFGVLSVWSLRP